MLNRWKNKLAAKNAGASGNLNILMLGDSSFSGMWSDGYGYSAAGLIYKHFSDKYGAASFTQGAYQPLAQPFPAISEFNYTRYYGTWIEWVGLGVARGPLSLGDASGGMSKVFTGEGFRLYMSGWSYFSQMTLTIDGGAPITIPGGHPEGKDYIIYESPRLNYGPHSFDLKVNGSSSSGACIYATETIESFDNGGVRLHNLSLPGLKTGDLFSLNEFVGNRNTNLPSAFLPFSPDLVVICLGGNDILSGVSKSVFKENYRKIIEYIKANLPQADIMLMTHALIGAENNHTGETQAAYLKSVGDLATEHGAAFLDLCSLWSDGYTLTPVQMNEKYGYYPENDLIHPNNSGHLAMADRMLGIIDPAPSPPEEMPFSVMLFGDTPLPAESTDAALYIKYKGDGKGIYVSLPGSAPIKL